MIKQILARILRWWFGVRRGVPRVAVPPRHTCNGEECLVCDSALNEDEWKEYEHLNVLVFSTYLTKLFTDTLVLYELLWAGTPGSVRV
jgi:hypothetical protein